MIDKTELSFHLKLGHKSIQARYIKTASLSGRDHPTCGTTWKKACATLPGALQVAENHDVIELDGTGTSLHPYDCKLQPLEISINVNITSSNTSRANISCPMINIKSSHPTTSNITVNFTRLTLTNTPIVINDSSIVLQDVIVTKTSRYAIRGRYDLLDVTPYVTLLKSTFEDNEGKMLSFDFGGSPGISRGDAFIIKDTTFKKNKAENTSLLEISLSGLNVYSDLKVCFTNFTMDSNVAFRGVYVFSEVTNMTTRVSILDSQSKNNYWQWSGIQVHSNNSLYSDVEISRSTFLSNEGLDIGSGPGSCIYIDVEDGPGSVVLRDLRFEENKGKKIGKPVAVQKYGCVHIEFDGDSNAKVINLTSTNGETSAILFRIEQKNNTLEVINSTFMGLEAAFGAGVLMESWTCKVREGTYNCFYDTSVDHEVVARFVNCNFFNNRATNKGGAACIAPDKTFRGNLSFINCNFRDNFALDEGGHVYVGGGMVETVFQNTLFHQTKMPKRNEGTNMLSSINSGKVTMVDSSIDSDTRGSLQSLVKIHAFYVKGAMRITCPTGTWVDFQNLSFPTLLPKSGESRQTIVYIWNCKSCGIGLYSPLRGSWPNTKRTRICSKTCPHGAYCGENENIVAKEHWWCYNTLTNDKVSCSHCLTGRCCSMPKGQELPSPKKYNHCCGNRTGVLCGRCKDGFVETLFGSQCVPYDEAHDSIYYSIIGLFSLFFFSYIIYSRGKTGDSNRCSCRNCCHSICKFCQESGDSNSCSCCSSCCRFSDKCCDFFNAVKSARARLSDLFAEHNGIRYILCIVFGYQSLGLIIEESPENILTQPARHVKWQAKSFSGSPPVFLGVQLWQKVYYPLISFAFCLAYTLIYLFYKNLSKYFKCCKSDVDDEGHQNQPKDLTSEPTASGSEKALSLPLGPLKDQHEEQQNQLTNLSEEPTTSPKQTLSQRNYFIFTLIEGLDILKDTSPYLFLPLTHMVFTLSLRQKIKDRCHNQFAPEDPVLDKEQRSMTYCFLDSNGLPLMLLLTLLSFLFVIDIFFFVRKRRRNIKKESDKAAFSDYLESARFHRCFLRYVVKALLALIAVWVVEPDVKQASIVIILLAFLVRLQFDPHGLSPKHSDAPGKEDLPNKAVNTPGKKETPHKSVNTPGNEDTSIKAANTPGKDAKADKANSPNKEETPGKADTFELIVIVFLIFVSALTIGTHNCISQNVNLDRGGYFSMLLESEWSLACIFGKTRFLVLFVLFWGSLLVFVPGVLYLCFMFVHVVSFPVVYVFHIIKERRSRPSAHEDPES
ncbi:hypothetical protein AC249_AIPGENE9927 [Exaiptasia diaphana]|nr:hypothetical protein AC249_AIPGENE9927 [Exaiptasia diaphana]